MCRPDLYLVVAILIGPVFFCLLLAYDTWKKAASKEKKRNEAIEQGIAKWVYTFVLLLEDGTHTETKTAWESGRMYTNISTPDVQQKLLNEIAEEVKYARPRCSLQEDGTLIMKKVIGAKVLSFDVIMESEEK